MSKVKGRKLRKGRDKRGVQTGRNARRLCSPVLVEELLGMEQRRGTTDVKEAGWFR